jgi:stage II sporulation protein E
MDDLPVDCKKRNRLLQELRRSQDQLRILTADRQRQREYRSAVTQQYHFLSEYLQELADQLPQRGAGKQPRFHPEVAVCSSGKEMANGDRCMWFAGTQSRYYLLLCDGMGTGADAAQEAKNAGGMLRRLLMAGYPAGYALRSVNSLCALRGQAGAVTVDLAEFRLDSGKVSVYKWGAAPSWLLLPTGAEQIGSGGTPPGLSVTENRETVDNLTMRHGEMLILLSDGIHAAQALQSAEALLHEAPGAVAARLLEQGGEAGMDDATAAVIRLTPV